MVTPSAPRAAPAPRPRRDLARRGGALAAALLALTLASSPGPAGADGPPGPGEDAAISGDPARRMELAKDLFREGVVRFNADDLAGALDLFLRSKALVPSYPNTRNAAVCLYRLGRDLEALDMYEEVLRLYGGALDGRDRADIESAVATLHARVGTVEVTSTAGGQLFVDGQPRGALPLAAPVRVAPGEHAIRVEQDGYEIFELTVQVPPGAPIAIRATLRPLPRAPAPPDRPAPAPAPPAPPDPAPPEGLRGGWFLEGYAGPLIGGGLGSGAERDAEATCDDDCPGAGGYLLGIRGGYLFDLGLALELGGGALSLSSAFQRVKQASFGSDPPFPVTYRLADEIHLRASLMTAGASYRLKLGPAIRILARASAGLASARSADLVTGTATTGGATVPAAVTGRARVLPSAFVFLMPEVGVEAAWRGFHVGAHLGVPVIVSSGPSFSPRQVGVAPDCDNATPGSVGCSPDAVVAGSERAYGPVQLWAPQIAVGYTF
jgi:hypothetical protein